MKNMFIRTAGGFGCGMYIYGECGGAGTPQA